MLAATHDTATLPSGMSVAIKCLHNPETLAKEVLEQEAMIGFQMDHPNVSTILGITYIGEAMMIIMGLSLEVCFSIL